MAAYLYLWDRTRQIRAELSYQQCYTVEAAELYQQIARFHICSEHRLCDDLDYQMNHRQQNMEQLNATLVSLREIYLDLASRNIFCEGESEFQSYLLLTQLDGPVLQLAMALRGKNVVTV